MWRANIHVHSFGQQAVAFWGGGHKHWHLAYHSRQDDRLTPNHYDVMLARDSRAAAPLRHVTGGTETIDLREVEGMREHAFVAKHMNKRPARIFLHKFMEEDSPAANDEQSHTTNNSSSSRHLPHGIKIVSISAGGSIDKFVEVIESDADVVLVQEHRQSE